MKPAETGIILHIFYLGEPIHMEQLYAWKEIQHTDEIPTGDRRFRPVHSNADPSATDSWLWTLEIDRIPSFGFWIPIALCSGLLALDLGSLALDD